MEKITRNNRTSIDENSKSKEVDKTNENFQDSFQEVTEEIDEINIENNTEDKSETSNSQSEETIPEEDFIEQENDNAKDVLTDEKPPSMPMKRKKQKENHLRQNYRISHNPCCCRACCVWRGKGCKFYYRLYQPESRTGIACQGDYH